MRRTAISFLLCIGVLTPLLAAAATFSDVPKNAEYAAAVTALVDGGIVNGNPDGTFRPQIPVNRASVLKMAYKAAGRTPAVSSLDCFPKEFKADAWFAGYVCDALARKYVQGFNDGTFRAEAMVSLSQALKIFYTVLELPAPPVTAADTDGLPFRLSPFHWAARYVVAAYRDKILPLPGMDNTYLLDDPIDRSQVAMLLYRAWQVRLDALHQAEVEQQLAVLHMVSSSSSSSSEGSTVSSSVSSVSSSASSTDPNLHEATIPFSDTDAFQGVSTRYYRFNVATKMVVAIDVTLPQLLYGHVICRLYKLEEGNGISNEYYLGTQDANACYLRTALAPGRYQVEFSTMSADAAFKVNVKEGTGDGNDGLSDAIPLTDMKLRSGFFEPNDLEDWYVFTVDHSMELSLDTTSDGPIGCLLYPWNDVSLPSFEIPGCNQSFMYPTGTYYVRLTHGLPRAGKQTYTIMLRTK